MPSVKLADFLISLATDPEKLAALKSDPDGVMGSEFSDAEKRAVVSGDAAVIHRALAPEYFAPAPAIAPASSLNLHQMSQGHPNPPQAIRAASSLAIEETALSRAEYSPPLAIVASSALAFQKESSDR